MKKMKVISILICVFLLINSASVFALNKDNVQITKEEFTVDKVDYEIEVKDYGDHRITTIEDENGNVAKADSRENYVEENGVKYYYTVTEEVTNFDPVSVNPMSRVKVPNWQKIRTSKVTIAFKKAIVDLTITAISAAIGGKIGNRISLVAAAKAVYSQYKSKPDLKNSKAFYEISTTYGRTGHLSMEATKYHSQDGKGRNISGTTVYYNPTPYKFP